MAEEAPPNNRKKKIVLWGMVLFFLVLFIALAIYWLTILRFEESTDDAYVNGNQIIVSPQIFGYIKSIYADETDVVQEGQILVSLDTTDQKIAFEQAKHQLAETLRQTVGLFERVPELEAEKKIKEAERKRAWQDYTHRKNLQDGGAVSIEQFEHADATYVASQEAVTQVEHQLQAAIAEIENTTILTHPQVEEAKDRVRRTFVDLQRCEVQASSHGMIANRLAQVGESASPNDPLMSLVPLDQIWVNANFKETQLENVRIGQPVTMTADLYGCDVVYHGKVMGLWPGTGSIFSVLPPQNATGNWIKIVQRLPVRISLDPEEIKQNPLVLGLSMQVTIDTHDRSGSMLPTPIEARQLFKTTIYHRQLQGVEEVISKIIEENLRQSDHRDSL